MTGVEDSFIDALSIAYNEFSKQIMIELTAFEYEPHKFGFSDLNLVSREFAIQKFFELRAETYIRRFLFTDLFEKILEERGHDVYKGIYNGPEDQYIDGEYFCSNKEFEDHAGFEIIFTDENKRIGCRLTDINAWDTEKWFTAGLVQKIIVIDWMSIDGISEEETKRRLYGINDDVDIVGIRQFVSEWLGEAESKAYELFMRRAIQDYQETIGISSLPKLTAPILFEHRLEEERTVLKSKIKDTRMFASIEKSDAGLPEEKRRDTHFGYRIIDFDNFKTEAEIKHARNVEIESKELFLKTDILEEYSNKRLYKALVGRGDFAKSFLTSEYLYSQYNESDLFDYTAIVSGYLKSVEQLLRVIVFFHVNTDYNGTKKRIKSNGKRKSDGSFPISSRKEGNVYKIDFLSDDEECVDTTIGSLNHFIEDYSQDVIRVNDTYKKVIIDCLECYRIECRNDSFHQHNNYDWDRVEKIRHNTIFLYMLMLGGLKLDPSEAVTQSKLKIIADDGLERLYYWLRRNQMYSFRVKLPGESEYYRASRSAEGAFPRFDDNGLLLDDFKIELHCKKEKNSGEADKKITITRDNLPEEVWYTTYMDSYPIDFSV